MTAVTRIAAQGDLLLRRRDSLPKGARRREVSKRLVLAHSETGHHHAIDLDGDVQVEVYDVPDVQGMSCFLRVDGEAPIVHHRGWDTHGTVTLTSGIWECRRQREYTPEGWRRIED
jgi:hypothetical protein